MHNLPAHTTKHCQELAYTLPNGTDVTIAQDDASIDSTGRTVWLGAQVLSIYLQHMLGRARRGWRAIDLGSGTGLVALTLASLGYDTLATDVDFIVDGVLRRNVEANRQKLREGGGGRLEARTLDWFVDPSSWPFSSEGGDTGQASEAMMSIQPPFNLITTADTVYDPSLSTPLLSTLRFLSLLSSLPPPIYLALEARDPALVAAFFRAAVDDFGFKCARIEHAKVKKLVEDKEGTLGWENEEDWEGVELWKLKLSRAAAGEERRRRQ
ncbi:Protein-lysine methyltransferase METTL21D [Rhodotorula toruloides]|nr:Protein-lysine methyltransferase METTL21D [Rhodotorula toruloides]